MGGVEGLGRRALAGRQGPGVADKAAAFDQLGMQVTPENVLGIYGVIQEEVTRLTASVAAFQGRFAQGMPALSDDLVSPLAARGFTEVTNQLLARCRADIGDLSRVAQGLAQAARAYGMTEAQLAAAFDPRLFQYQPAQAASPSTTTTGGRANG